MRVSVCAYLCIWHYDWCLCVFGVCVCVFVSIVDVCLFLCMLCLTDAVVRLWILLYDWCWCVFVCLLTSLSCRGWIGWLCRTALVNFQTTCLLPQLPAPISHTSNSNTSSSNTQTSEDSNILNWRPHVFPPSSHLTQASNSNTSSSNIWTFKHLNMRTFLSPRPHVFSPSPQL